MDLMAEILSLPSVALAENRQLPEKSGVYFAIIDGSQIAYVGATWSFQQRWRAHNKRLNLVKLGSVRVHYLEVDEEIMCAVEQDVIDLFQPCLNHAPAIWGNRLNPGEYLPEALGRPRKPRPAAAP